MSTDGYADGDNSVLQWHEKLVEQTDYHFEQKIERP